jgi:hypothetical protein
LVNGTAFFISKGFAFVVDSLATHVVLHRISIRTLGEPFQKLGAGLGSVGESMLPYFDRL